MTRSPSAEPSKTTKRKGTRSVSTLTPSQLARKRANDREAQRAIRARTKEHIERLERELDELKKQNRDETVQQLIRRNKALEQELMQLKESLGIQNRPYPAPGYEVDGLPTVSTVSSRASSFGQGSTEYSSAPSFGPSYLPTPEPCDSWSSVVPISSVSVPSVVSSPSSSTGHPDDYVPGYIPTSVPTSMMDGSVLQPSAMPCLDGGKAEYEDIENADRGYCHSSIPQHSSTSYLQQQSWSMYPTNAYYPQSPAI
ncbi:hypothetical protein B0T22DRAFT_277995 [Podospora appendiculata]|uniref:BZIP domain-containing protein n=1 Tax=Podospora appendiculata TaxID=314037 RepID=A0AAE0X0J7_9PEZI|nr:hypothetical protein B0T22DRAFT_277995 [Podospora appendiculata]